MRTILNLSLSLAFPLVSFAQAAPLANSSAPVAIVAGQPISEQDLAEALGPQGMQLRKQEYEAKSSALENLIRLKVVQVEAKKRGISAEKLIEQEVDSKIADATDGEVEAYFWGQNREGANFDEVKERYRATLKRLKQQRGRQVYADALRAKTDVAVLLRPPSVNVTYDPARVKGDPKAPVTIVEFSDFQCPYCQKTESILSGLLDKYKGHVKLAYMDFPLQEIHLRAELAAEASRCAGEQGKFWEFHDALFADTGKLDDSDLLARAQTLGLQEEPFRACLASGKFKASVNADREAGVKAGVAGTPGFFINGVFLSGAQPESEFEKIIKNELSLLRSHSEP